MKESLMIFPLVILLCFTFGCQQVEEGITEEEAKALFESAQEIWNNGNLAFIEDVYLNLKWPGCQDQI